MCSSSRLNQIRLTNISKSPREAFTTPPHVFRDNLTRAYLRYVDTITEPSKRPRELLASASCGQQQRLARVLTFTLQPNAAEMRYIDMFIYIVYIAGQVALTARFSVTPADVNSTRRRGVIPTKYGIPALGAMVRFSHAWDTLSIIEWNSLSHDPLGQLGCTLILTSLQCPSKYMRSIIVYNGAAIVSCQRIVQPRLGRHRVVLQGIHE